MADNRTNNMSNEYKVGLESWGNTAPLLYNASQISLFFRCHWFNGSLPVMYCILDRHRLSMSTAEYSFSIHDTAVTVNQQTGV